WPSRKLTPHQREEALRRLAAGGTQADVARSYNDNRPLAMIAISAGSGVARRYGGTGAALLDGTSCKRTSEGRARCSGGVLAIFSPRDTRWLVNRIVVVVVVGHRVIVGVVPRQHASDVVQNSQQRAAKDSDTIGEHA